MCSEPGFGASVASSLRTTGAGSPVLPRRVQKHKRTQDRRAGAISIVINPWRAPDLGVGGNVGDSSSPSCAKTRPF